MGWGRPRALTELDELREEGHRKRRRKEARQRARRDPNYVRTLRDWHATWPTIPARTKVLLAEKGMRPDAPEAVEIAQLSAKKVAREATKMDRAKARGKRRRPSDEGGDALAAAAQGAPTGLADIGATVGTPVRSGRVPEEQDPRLLQMIAQNQEAAAATGPTLQPAQADPLVETRFAIRDKGDAQRVLAENGPLTFQEVDRLWAVYPEMSGDERERMRDRLAGINPQRREERALRNGVAYEDQARSANEQKRLSVLRQYESQLRRGVAPAGSNPAEERILSEMRVRLAGVDPNAVIERGGTLTPEETVDIEQYMQEEKKAEQGIDLPLRGFAAGTRALGTALQAPYEFMQGQVRERVRNVGGAIGGDPEAAFRVATGISGQGILGELATGDVGTARSVEATTAGQVGKALIQGRPVDQGTGIFPSPDSPIGRAQAQAARDQLEIYGQAATPGRLLARGLVGIGVIDKDSTAYTVASGLTDAVLAVSPFDPTNVVLDTYSAAKRSSKLFRTGVGPSVEGRTAFMRGTFDSWLTGNDGQKVTNELFSRVQADDFAGVREMVSNTPTAVRLMDAASVDDMNAVLRRSTGLDPGNTPSTLGLPTLDVPITEKLMLEKPQLPKGAGYEIRKRLDNVRLFHDMPNRPIDLTDPDEALDTFDLVQRTAKLPPEVREANNYEFAKAVVDGGRPAVLPVYTKMLNDVVEAEVSKFAGSIRGQRMGDEAVEAFRKEVSQKHGKVFLDSYERSRAYMLDAYGNNTAPFAVGIDGTRQPLAEPSRFVEFLNRALPIPNAREIRQNVSWAHSLWQDELTRPFLTGSATALDTFYGKVFKPLALITRLAYPVRVIGEEQFRMGAAGYDSMFSGHPLSDIAWIVGRKGGLSEDDMARAAAEAVAGRPTPFGEAMSRNTGPMRLLDDERTGSAMRAIRTKHRLPYAAGEDRYTVSWAEELLKDHNDPIVSAIAKTSAQEVKDRWWDGDLQWVREQMIRNGGDWDRIAEREGADAVIEFYVKHLQTITNNDPELLSAIATGRIGKHALVEGKVRPKINRDALKALDDRVERGVAPEYVPGDAVAHVAQNQGRYDEAVQSMFTALMGFPTDSLSRSVVFRQAYWKRVIDALPYAKDMDTAETILRRATDMEALGPKTGAFAKKMGIPEEWTRGIPKRFRTQMRDRLNQVGGGTLTVDDIDQAAKAHALDTTRDLLYDLSKRNNFFDITRHIFPFGDAFKEVTTRWAKLFRENPKAWYRFQQGYEAGHENGWIHQNEYGEDVITYPGSKFLTDKILGVPVPLDGPVANLNMVGQAYPGFGPAAQIPAMWMIPDKPQWDWLHELIFPFGEPANKDPLSVVVETAVPAWVEKVSAALGAPGGEQMMRRTTTRLAIELKSTGDYGTGEAEIRRLMSDARSAAKKLIFVQGIAQSSLPSSPLLNYQVLDRDGNLHVMTKVAEEFHNQREKNGHDEALDWLVKNYGKDIYPIIQGISSDLVFGLVNTQEAYDWERNHKGFMGKYSDVGGYFAPRGGEDDFDISVYQKRLDNGQKVIPDPEVTLRVANDTWARHLYDQEKERFADDEDYLRKYKAYLVKAYPGYESDVGKVGKASVDERIAQLETAAKDPEVRDTDAAKMVSEYAKERAYVTREARKRDITNWWDAKKTADLVEYLDEFQGYLRKKYGRAATDILDQVYSRDLGYED